MATVEVASSVGLIAKEEQVKAAEDAVKVTEIEPANEKALEEEAPASTPAEEVPATEEKVDDGPTTGEASAEEISVAPPALEGEPESAQVNSGVEAAQVPEEADPAKEGFAAEVPAESAAVETAAEEKGEEILAQEETPAEVPEEKIASVEESAVEEAESAVEEAKPAEAVPVEEKTEGEGKAEE